MGVSGLTPFLQKLCPTILKKFPERLEALKGKRIVIDGTLITQRFHFVSNEHANYNVLGWYRLARELNRNNISAICVFDGKERNIAKANETKRRREVRQLTMARGSIEDSRYRRLHDLKAGIDQLQGLDSSTKQDVLNLLKESPLSAVDDSQALLDQTTRETTDVEPFKPEIPVVEPSDTADIEPSKTEIPVVEPSEIADVEPPKTEIPAIEPSDTADIEPSKTEIPVVEPSDTADVEPSKTEIPAVEPSDKIDIEPSKTGIPMVEPSEIIKPQPVDTLPPDSKLATDPIDLANLFKSLHISYKANMAKLASVSTSEGLPQAIVSEEDSLDKKMSKQQYELTVQEGKIWAEICGGVEKSILEISAVADNEVDSLLEKSQVMANSFQKRNNAPTVQTYQDAKKILSAMGILCIDATGAIEAEALASSMVLNGFADYVVSEDTDVLAYEAPMIRNITSLVEPLLVISGADARKELELDREAYVDLLLLMGTDFSQRIKNLGPVRAYGLIKKHGSIERILDAIEGQPKYELKLSREAYMAQVQIARLVFATLPPVPGPELMKQVEKNDAHVTEILRQHGLERYTADEFDYQNALSGTYFQDNPHAA